MPSVKDLPDFITQLDRDISSEVGNMQEDNLKVISDEFNQTLSNALNSFGSSVFDDEGFIKRMRGMDLDGKDKDVMKHVLNNVRSDYMSMDVLGQSELLLRRDVYNVCTQMPEMRDVIYLIRDGIVECNVATGEISRTLDFENHEDNESYESLAKEVEKNHKLKKSIKNFILPKTLQNGEMYVHKVPYAKLFAELELLRDAKNPRNNLVDDNITILREFKESIPNYVQKQFTESKNLYSEQNVELLMESVTEATKTDVADEFRTVNPTQSTANMTQLKNINKTEISGLLRSIDIHNGSSELMAEMGYEGLEELVYLEYKDYLKKVNKNKKKEKKPEDHFMEGLHGMDGGNIFGAIDQDDVKIGKYKDIKGVYLKYLDPLKMIPIRIDQRIVGYYYVTTTMDLQVNAAQPNGIVDLSYQKYSKDKKLVDQLAGLIIKSFDKKMLQRNIQLKDEIAEIVMAHKFSEGKLSFIYIPENEVQRFVVNEDENGKGHSVIEPTLFSARNYMMLNMYNILYTLNNNTTRIHYLKSSGLNKDYASQIQRTIRNFQSRRINIDDIYSYQGVLNKIGGMGEMVLPAGRNDYRALETDTIEAVNIPINVDFLEQQRRQALSGTGAPHLLIINAIDEVDFAKTLELANTRFLSTVSSYKIDFNEQLTELYQFLLKYETDLDDDIIQSFRFKFNPAKQKEIEITADMINNFNSYVELVMAIYYKKSEMEDEKGNPTAKQMHLRKELAMDQFGQLDFDNLDKIVKRVNLAATEDDLQDIANGIKIEEEDIEQISDKKTKE